MNLCTHAWQHNVYHNMSTTRATQHRTHTCTQHISKQPFTDISSSHTSHEQMAAREACAPQLSGWAQSHAWAKQNSTHHTHDHRCSQAQPKEVEIPAAIHRYVCEVHVLVCMYMCMCAYVCVCVCVGTYGGRRHARFTPHVTSLIEYHSWQVLRYEPE